MMNDPTLEQLETADDAIRLSNMIMEKADEIQNIIHEHLNSGNSSMSLKELTDTVVLISRMSVTTAAIAAAMLEQSALQHVGIEP